MKHFDSAWASYVRGREDARVAAQAALLAAFASEPVLEPIRWRSHGDDRSEATVALTIGDLTLTVPASATFWHIRPKTGWTAFVGTRSKRVSDRAEARKLAERMATEELHKQLAAWRREFARRERLAQLRAESAELVAARDEVERLQALVSAAHAALRAVEARLEAQAAAETKPQPQPAVEARAE